MKSGAYMENKFAQQLKKGSLDMVVLRLILKKQTYGYEILQELERLGRDFFTLKEGTLYPVLYRLEDNGLIESSWQQGHGRSAPKKYYSVTEKGQKAYLEYRELWVEFQRCIQKICEEE